MSTAPNFNPMKRQSVTYRKSLGILGGAIACLLIAQLFPEPAAAADKYEKLILADRPVAYWRCQPPKEKDPDRVTANSAAVAKQAVRTVCRGNVRFIDGLPGTQGQAAAFDGKTAHLHMPMIKALQLDTLSIEFWFKTKQKFDNTFWPGSAAFLTIATRGAGTSDFTINAASTRRGEDQGRLLFCTGPAGTGRDHYLWSPEGYRLNDGRWHHGQPHREVERLQLVGPGLRHGQSGPVAHGVGKRRTPRRRFLRHSRRRGGYRRRTLERLRLVRIGRWPRWPSRRTHRDAERRHRGWRAAQHRWHAAQHLAMEWLLMDTALAELGRPCA